MDDVFTLRKISPFEALKNPDPVLVQIRTLLDKGQFDEAAEAIQDASRKSVLNRASRDKEYLGCLLVSVARLGRHSEFLKVANSVAGKIVAHALPFGSEIEARAMSVKNRLYRRLRKQEANAAWDPSA